MMALTREGVPSKRLEYPDMHGIISKEELIKAYDELAVNFGQMRHTLDMLNNLHNFTMDIL